MLSIYVSRYCMRQSSGVLFQWLNVSARWCSSSDSSSDSDSDSEKQASAKTSSPKNAKQESIKTAQVETEDTDLTNFLTKVIEGKKLEKTINVAVYPRKPKPVVEKPVPYEKKLMNAAEDVASAFGGDKAKTTSELLEKVLPSETKTSFKNKEFTNNIQSDEGSMQFTVSKSKLELNRKQEFRQSPEREEQASFANIKRSEKKSVIHSLLKEYKKSEAATSQQSRYKAKQYNRTQYKTQYNRNDIKKPHDDLDFDLWNGKPTAIFQQENTNVPSPYVPELKTWSALEKADLKALTIHPPTNIFQEMILWTEQGKLWKFPIDNEQGLEEEQNVHFSEHVFMERHLKGWCPTLGPIRHFMELVCNGLSKNPYLTVQEKIDHIMWYKDYFKTKESLLQEVGAIKEPLPYDETPKQVTE